MPCPSKRRRRGVEDVPAGHGEAEVVKPWAFGVEGVAGGGNRSQAKQDAVGLVDHAAVQLGRVLADDWVIWVAGGLRGDFKTEDLLVERAGPREVSDCQTGRGAAQWC